MGNESKYLNEFIENELKYQGKSMGNEGKYPGELMEKVRLSTRRDQLIKSSARVQAMDR